MSAVDLRIERVRQSLEVSGAPDGTEERLRRLAPTAFDRLAGLLGEFGDNDGHWCIRELACHVLLDVDANDEALLSAWALDLIAGVQAATHRAESADDVVFYPSRELAVLDCIVSTEAGRTERLWAWRQLGLVTAADAPGSGGGLDCVRMLADSARTVTPLFRSLRALGLLDQFIDRLHDSELTTLVSLAAPQATWALKRAAEHAFSLEMRIHRGPATASAVAVVNRLLDDSSILRQCRTRSSPEAAAAVVVLAAVESDAGWATTVSAATWLSVIDAWLDRVHPASGPTLERAANAPDSIRETAIELATKNRLAARPETAAPEPTWTNDDGVPQEPTDVGDTLATSTSVEPDGGDTAELVSSAAPNPRTGAAGLLFLLNVIDEEMITSWWDRFAGEKPLHQLLRAIATDIVRRVGIHDLDPAVLVFAGEWPDATDRASGTALEDLDPRVETCTDDVLAALERWLQRTEVQIDLAELVTRSGLIGGAVPWIEVTLPMDDISIVIRCAALDADPGWIPWLGTVLRFRYV
jgi:hypothetical protein